MDPISDLTMGAIEYALGGVARRSDVRSNNVANANTPGFLASTVSFESSLAMALDNGSLEDLSAPETLTLPGIADGTGNTVSMEDEMVGSMKDNLMFTTLVQAYNFKVGLLRTAIGGGGAA